MNLWRSIKKRFGKKVESSYCISNLYKTGYSQKVFISYLVSPFREGNHFKHQNYLTSHIVAEAFSELGYNVDVYDYQAKVEIPYDTYDVIFGIGDNFERSFYSNNRLIPRIHLVTGTHQNLHNENGLKSIKDFFEISGIWLNDETNIMQDNHYYAMHEADVALLMAEGFVFENFRSAFKNKLYTLNNNILGVFSGFATKDKPTRNFLFLSGGKQLTKGLTLILEAARIRKDVNFYVVVPKLNGVLENYFADVIEQENVFLFKDLSMNSEEMKRIVETCSYVIAPSYVDGLPGGTIEPMSAGLIPVVSKFCGFAQQEFIFEIDELTVPGVLRAIEDTLSKTEGKYMELSKQVRTYAVESYSRDAVKERLKYILKNELG